jgi:hypothetical protein
MLILMIDMCFKSMWLVTMYLGWKNIVILVVEYDEKLFPPLLIEVAKLLMPICGEKFENLMS